MSDLEPQHLQWIEEKLIKLFAYLDSNRTTLHGRSWPRYPGDSKLKQLYPAEIQLVDSLVVWKWSLRDKISFLRNRAPINPGCTICQAPARWYAKDLAWHNCCEDHERQQTCLDRYGVTNAAKSIQAKANYEATCLEHYGAKSSAQAESVKAKAKETALKNWGVDNASKSPKVVQRIRDSFISSYGVSNAMKVKKFKLRQQKSCLEHYGVDNPSRSPEVIKQIGDSTQAIYGVRHALQSPEVQKRFRATCRERYGKSHHSGYSDEIYAKIENSKFWQEEYLVKKKEVWQIAKELGIDPSNAFKYFRYHAPEISLRCSHSSYDEGVLADFIESYLPIERQKNLVGRKSLDIYVPQLHLAFEYNGIYWHSEINRERDYHLQKTLECESQGIRLVHIWEDDWLGNMELMKRKVKALLGVETEKVFARKCQIIVPTKEQKSFFFKANHIKGNDVYPLAFALKYQDQLVAMISFKDTSEGWYLSRYATSCSVPGGFSRLLEHFKRSIPWQRIYTYADRSWSQGNVYLKCGFNLIAKTEINYQVIEHCERIHSARYTREYLKERFPDLYSEELTKFQIMDLANLNRIWDCGQLKFELLNN